jgi:UPF0271 protein
MRIDLNADVGESFGAYSLGLDEELLPLVTSANVACGFHAGDPQIMDRTVALLARLGVALGAHPSLLDLRGFGRRWIAADPREIETDVVYQVGALEAFGRAHGARLVHVKPHGSLYNQAADDETVARAVARGVARARGDLVLVGLAGSNAMREAASACGLRFVPEAFADRRYLPDGRLVPRTVAGSVIGEPAQAAAQGLRMARDGVVEASDGSLVPVRPETLCVHGDNPAAPEIARALREALEAAGIQVRPLSP